jgi:hypothetical protein
MAVKLVSRPFRDPGPIVKPVNDSPGVLKHAARVVNRRLPYLKDPVKPVKRRFSESKPPFDQKKCRFGEKKSPFCRDIATLGLLVHSLFRSGAPDTNLRLPLAAVLLHLELAVKRRH